ncbi:MAG: HAMP domain-containing protein [Betaproteobacteria bacterium]|nr:HAMP domain-containing protein [Betaproteobacteria bacterium]MBK7080638.1 HAMP domain-containing protein [Betaproteobacteria bacterium]MBK8688778.1 HAMP domain-containing protein [Betaproteobacteria bacterium]
MFPSRAVRWLLLIFACLAAISLFLLATASANTSLFARRYDLLLLLNTALVALLMALVGYQLLRLRRSLRRGVFGSRLALRLVLLFALVAVLPGALVYAVSVQFLGKSIESWFDVRVDRALEGGLNLGRNALDYLLKETTNKAGQIAINLSEGGAAGLASRLGRIADQTGVAEAALFSSSGAVLAVAGVAVSTATPEPPPPQAVRRARLQQSFSAIEQGPEGTLLLRVVVPVNVDDRLEPLRLLQIVEPVPKGLAQDAEKVQAGWRDYQEISFSRASLKKVYGLTLTLTLLLALTSALGLAVVLSEKFAEPLGLLAEGTRAVAQGDFTRRQPVTSRDELGVLTESFNTMTQQLADAHAKAEESRRATETTRAYLESILGNLSAGVLAFDDRHRLRTANASAAVILQQPLADLGGVPLAEWGRELPALSSFAELVDGGFRESPGGQWQRQAELSVANVTRTLLLRGSQLPVEPVAGYVVVFDDVTDLAQAQRDAAWGEVARRLAHEIKNPLTPIQLSAERLEVKLFPKLDPADQETLRRGAGTIVAQVAAMKQMVDDFAVYARQPRPGRMQAVDLTALLQDVLALYENLRPQVALSLPAAPLVIQGEPTRLRQVFHNLLQNAIDAQADSPTPRYEITLAERPDGAALTFADAGPGFGDEVLHRAFEPYVTTKAKGTGLGLAIVKKIIEEHHGRVELANRVPHGAQVTLIFRHAGTGVA